MPHYLSQVSYTPWRRGEKREDHTVDDHRGSAGGHQEGRHHRISFADRRDERRRRASVSIGE